MYGGDFGHVDLSQVVEVNGQVTIATIADLDKSLRSHKERGLRAVVLGSSIKVGLVPGLE